MSSALYPRILSGTPDKAEGRRQRTEGMQCMYYMITQPPPGEAILISIFDILDKRDWRETRETREIPLTIVGFWAIVERGICCTQLYTVIEM